MRTVGWSAAGAIMSERVAKTPAIVMRAD